jgi:hypothetical protein
MRVEPNALIIRRDLFGGADGKGSFAFGHPFPHQRQRRLLLFPLAGRAEA